MLLLDGNGNRAVTYSYDEFGRDLSGNQGTFQPFGYTGYQKDETAGMYYAQAREYDAWSGRFTGEDIVKGSVAYPETLNVYGYCWGNPLKYVDGDGRWPKKNINDEIEESYKKVRTWIYKNVEVNKSLTITSRDNLGIIGKYKTNTYSSKEKNKKINVSFDNSSIVTVSIRGNQNIGGISANGSVGISKNGAKSSCIYSWKDKEDVERYLKVQTDMKNIVLEWMTEDSKEGGGIRFSTDESEVYTFTTKDLGDSKYREENGAYINNAFAILAMVTIVALAPEIMSVLGGMTPTIPAWIMLLTIVLGAEYLKDKECEI